MSVLLLIAGAAALPATLKPPEPRRPIVTYSDYPIEAAANGEQGAVLFRAIVNPQGKVVDCEVQQIVGEDFGTVICDRAKRARFDPAKGPDGKLAYGVYRSVASFWIPMQTKWMPSPFPGMSPDLVLSVKPVPGLLTERRRVPLAVTVDSEGHVSSCTSLDDSAEASLATPACAQITAQWTGEVVKDSEGAPTPYVTKLTVEFQPENAKP